jgi:tetratricopeptide (TPR) repeat protein
MATSAPQNPTLSPAIKGTVTVVAVLLGLAPLSLFMLRCYENLRESGTMELQSLREEGMALLDGGKPQEAARRFEKALQFAPNAPDVHLLLADSQMQLGRADDAIGHYRRSIELDPHNAAAHGNLGAALASRREFSEAEKHLRSSLKLKPDDPPVLINLARVIPLKDSADRRRLDDAIGFAERACRLTSNRNGPYLVILARLYNRAGRRHEAVETAQRALELRRQAGSVQRAPESGSPF